MDPDSQNKPDEQNTSSPSPGGVIKPADSQSPLAAQPPQTVQPADLPQVSAQNPAPGPKPDLPQNPDGSKPIFPSDSSSPPSSGRVLNKKLILLILIPLLLVLLAAGYVFGYYIPNRPENAYKTGLDRSGDALQMIVDKATQQQTYDNFKKSEITANLDINSGGQNVKGDFKAKFDGSKMDTDLNVNFPNGDSQTASLGLSILSEKADGKEFPDTYFNLRGIKALGVDLFLPGINKYDNKWVEISSDYIASLAKQSGVEPNQPDNTGNYPTFDEISSLIRDVYGVTNEYVLTSDPNKAVLVNKQYLGKEEVEGVNTFHYEVGINKDHYKAYCEAVSNVLLNSPAPKKFLNLKDEQIEQEKQKIAENCQKDSESIKDEDTFEMWVDTKYKLIKKVRIYSSKENKGEYYELGQNYDGSDKVSLFFATVSDKGGFSSKTTITTDLNVGESSGEFTFSGGTAPDNYDGKVTLSAKPLSEDFTITKPSKTTSIDKILKEIGIDPKALIALYGGNPAADFVSGNQAQSQDAQIKSNVNAVYSHLEVYFAENAIYPTSSQLNDQSWQASNMSGFNADFLSGVEYNPSDCNDNGCLKYTLSAKLSDGSTFEKTGSNN